MFIGKRRFEFTISRREYQTYNIQWDRTWSQRHLLHNCWRESRRHKDGDNRYERKNVHSQLVVISPDQVVHTIQGKGSRHSRHRDRSTQHQQGMPNCYAITRKNRPERSRFRCISCGLEGETDLIASINIRIRTSVNQPIAAGAIFDHSIHPVASKRASAVGSWCWHPLLPEGLEVSDSSSGNL